MLELNKIYNMDCLEGMKDIDDKSIDMILCDLPYGTTACKWDSIIPFEPLWEQYERVIKDNGAIVLTASQPFTTKLIMSKLDWFRYTWVWNKKKAGNIFLAKKQPMKIHEDIVVFSKKPHFYNPQMVKRDKVKKSKNYGTGESFGGTREKEDKVYTYTHTYPKSIIEFSNARQKEKVHPTQKPVALFEYLIKTYTNKGETVLDNCMGSGTTAIACINTNRKYIGIELDDKYFEIAKKRIESVTAVQMEFKGV
jgi:site-specific DNA-methyltransferase (adenine-specific)